MGGGQSGNEYANCYLQLDQRYISAGQVITGSGYIVVTKSI